MSNSRPFCSVRSYLLGANSYIRKPVDFGEFTDAIRHLKLYWLMLNNGPPQWVKT